MQYKNNNPKSQQLLKRGYTVQIGGHTLLMGDYHQPEPDSFPTVWRRSDHLYGKGSPQRMW